MKNSVFISIIIPCYNSEKYIGNCLNCLDAQTSKDYEVIFVDDGSSDNTLKILNEYEYENKKVISSKHVGPADARNIAVKEAIGHYVWFVDSDDIFEESAVETIIKSLKESNADVLRFSYKKNDNNQIKSIDPPYIPGIYEGDTLKEMQRYAVGYADAAPFFLWIHVYKRELIKDIPLLSLWDYLSESNSFNQRVYPRIKKFQVIDNVLYQYNIRPGSASFVHRPILDKTMNLFRALKDDFTSIGIYEEYKDVLAFCIVDTLMLGFCIPHRGAIVTEYMYCSSIEVAHKRIQDIMNTQEYDEVVREAQKLKANTTIKKAHDILIEKNENKLFSFLREINSK